VKYEVQFSDGQHILTETVEAAELRDNAEGKWVDFYDLGGHLVRRFRADRVQGVKAT
jgi:hypothetical protein